MMLWQCMAKHQTKDYPIDETLSPGKFLPAIVKRSDVLEWGTSLKQVLQSWIEDVESPFSSVQAELGSCLSKPAPCRNLEGCGFDNFTAHFPVNNLSLLSLALPLLTDLHTRGALPAILFNYDRDYCEKTVLHLLAQLETTEKEWMDGSAEWQRKLTQYKEWKKARAQAQSITKKPATKRGQDDGELSKIDMVRDEASVETSKWDSFDPDAPQDRFSFADGKKITKSELQTIVERLKHAGVNENIIRALGRGIAVHHAGMNRRYRQV